MRRVLPSITVCMVLVLALFVGLDFSFEIIPNVSSGLIEVDDSGGKDYLTIQEGVDAAIPGDIVFVYAGIYYEDVVINKTINLTGEDRDTTIINSTNLMGIYVENADYVNISGFTVVNGSWAGIRLMPSNNSVVENNRVEHNNKGLQIVESNNTVVRNNIASNNTNDYGIYLDRSTNITVKNNICQGNQGKGIYIFDNSNYNLISGNDCSGNADGIYIGSSSYNYICDNNLTYNLDYGIADFSCIGNFYINNLIENCYKGFSGSGFAQNVQIINTSIINSTTYDIRVRGPDNWLTLINTTFNSTKVVFDLSTNLLFVKWYLHINVIDYLGNPVSNTNIKIEDNRNSSYQEFFTTDINGHLRWLTVTEYIEQDTDGDTNGEKTYYTPHKITAWNDTLVGYAKPFINESKTITIVLYNGTFLNLESGWNLVSLPRIQSDSNLQTVLQSIEGQYDAVQWYNVTDNNDPWKHNHISKPSYLNDLNEINHTMGLWMYITDPGGTTLVVFGDVLTSIQNITLYLGWNLLGYPSTTDKTRTAALNNVLFDSDVDAIWTYNASTQTWKEITASDNFEIGQGYWVHSKVIKVWNIPL